MLVIRLQRTGRRGHAQFRVVVQESRLSPTSGKVVAYLGSYDPHTKTNTLNKEKAEFYLNNGAQPSERVVKLLQAEKIKLPSWVELPKKQEKTIKNIEKLRKNRPAEAEEPVKSEETSAEDEAPAEDANAEPAEKTELAEAEKEPAPEESAPAEAVEEAEPAGEEKSA